MKIKVVTVGKLKEKYLKMVLQSIQNEFLDLLSLKWLELADEKHQIRPVSQKIKDFRNRRSENFIKSWWPWFRYCVSHWGKNFLSEEFSKRLEEASIKGFSTLTFILEGVWD